VSDLIYLTVEDVLEVAKQVLNSGYRVRDYGLLDSALARYRAVFHGKEVYKNIFDKASALFESLIMNHAFVDGNKRITWISVVVFFRLNSYRLVEDHVQARTEEVILCFVCKKIDRAELTSYLRSVFVGETP
jgi:death-on-curing protein